MLNRNTRWCLVLAASALAAAVGLRVAPADSVKLDKPVRLGTVKTDKTRVAGKVVSYDESGFQIEDDKGVSQDVKWADLSAANAYAVYDTLIPRGTGNDWLEAGRVLVQLPGGKASADRAFARALHLDATLKAKIEEVKKDPTAGMPAAAAKPAAAGAARGAGSGENGSAGAGPITMGEVEANHWGKLSDAEQAESVKRLKEFAENTKKGKDGSLKLLETKYFLFYSDLKPTEATNWAGLLDKMYLKLAELFGVEKGVNLWRGKALVFVFAKAGDYRSFETVSHHTDPGTSAGMCHSFGDGMVHIAFYRQPEEIEFAHILVHESVHGFVHRYKSPAHVPSWANEGLAETIAAELVDVPLKWPQVRDRRASAQDSLRQRGVGPDFFETEHIAAWQYPIAENLCSFMIASNKKGYVEFINGLKEGLSVEDSLTKKYGAGEERIVPAYMESMGVKSRGK